MSDERQQLEATIAALEAQRLVLGDAVVDTALAPLREKLNALSRKPSSTAQQRKQVTVLFADVSGFTAMSETMDAEDVSNVMNALWEGLDNAITSHGGMIDKHIGDAVMALWGVDVAQEDDPEQAIRGALEMQVQLRAFAERMQSNLKMRIGLNTGPVLLGTVGTTNEFTAMGDTVNLASRLEHVAPVGGILISHDTYRHIRGIFDVQPQEPMAVKGKVDPVKTYVVIKEKPRAFRVPTRGVQGVETRMIGRDAELTQLQVAFQTAHTGQLQLVTVVGDAGVGKSRLLYEFDNWVDLLPQDVRYFRGRATLQTTGVPYGLLRDMFAAQFGILESDPILVVRDKFVGGTQDQFDVDGEMKAHFIGQLIGYDFDDSPHLVGVKDDPTQLRNRAILYLTQYLNRLTETSPLVMMLEDIHWADEQSLNTILELVGNCLTLRLQIVCLTRPNFFETHSTWGANQPFYSRIDIHPLAEADSHQLVGEILQKVKAVPDELKKLIVANAEGNPFYVEELIKILIDDGVIRRDEDQWEIETSKLATLRIPPTLTAVLQARLDSLSLSEKATLQQASVVGRIFWDEPLQRLHEADVDLPRQLEDLTRREMIFSRDLSAFDRTNEYIFKHALLRDVTYESVLKRARRVYHQKVAEWLIAATEKSGRTEEYTAIIADHYAFAEDTTNAVKYFEKAGRHAYAISAYGEATAITERALGMLEGPSGDDTAYISMRILQGDIAEKRGNYAVAIDYYQEALELARAQDDSASIATSLNGLGMVTMRKGDYATALQHFEEAHQFGEALNDPRIVTEALMGLGNNNLLLGNYALTKAYYEQCLAMRRRINDRPGLTKTLNNYGLVLKREADLDGATAHFEQSLAISRETGDQYSQLRILINLGTIYSTQGKYDRASEVYQQSLGICDAINDRSGKATALLNLASTTAHRGDLRGAWKFYEESLALARELGEPSNVARTLINLGIIALWQGEYETAAKHINEGLAVHQELGERDQVAFGQIYLSKLARQQGDLAVSEAAIEASLATSREIEHANNTLIGLIEMANVKLALKDFEAARVYLREGLQVAKNMAAETRLLELVLVAGRLALARGDAERSAAWSGMVEGHPLTHYFIKIGLEELRSEIEGSLSEAELEAAWEKGKSLGLHEVLDELLAEFSTE